MNTILSPCPPSATSAIRAVSASTRKVQRWTATPDWLSPSERIRACEIGRESVRDAWLTARLAAKRLVAARLAYAAVDAAEPILSEIEIVSRNSSGRGVRPRAVIAGRDSTLTVSISHSVNRVLVAVGPAAGALGVDLTPGSAFTPAASRWWLTEGERHDARSLAAAAAAAHAAVVWSVKEAVYKARLSDEPFRPQAIEVRLRHGRITGCAAAGCRVMPSSIRTCWLDGHALALVHDGEPAIRATG
jgi:phosphopantetheinyl transferase